MLLYLMHFLISLKCASRFHLTLVPDQSSLSRPILIHFMKQYKPQDKQTLIERPLTRKKMLERPQIQSKGVAFRPQREDREALSLPHKLLLKSLWVAFPMLLFKSRNSTTSLPHRHKKFSSFIFPSLRGNHRPSHLSLHQRVRHRMKFYLVQKVG